MNMKDNSLSEGKIQLCAKIVKEVGVPVVLSLALTYLLISLVVGTLKDLSAGQHAQTLVLQQMMTGMQAFQDQVSKEHDAMSRELRDIDRGRLTTRPPSRRRVRARDLPALRRNRRTTTHNKKVT